MMSAPAPSLGPMVPEPVRIRAIRQETSDTFTMHFEVPGREGGFRFQPGQFNMLYLFGIGEVAISISGDAEQPAELVHTIRAVGTVTNAIRQQGKAALLGVRGPYGQGWPIDVARGRDLILVAGGVGLAPLRPVIYYVLKHRAEFRRVALVVGARSPDLLLFRRQIAAWKRDGRMQVLVTVDKADAAWKGPVGVVTSLLGQARFEGEQAVAFLCGPEVMMRFCERELARLGMGPEQLWFSLERNMRCALGLCGHCQLGPDFICKDGPVLRYDRLHPFFLTREA